MLIDTIKKAAKQTIDAGMPAAVLYGTVTAVDPVVVRVDNRFDVSGDALMIPKTLREGAYSSHRHRGFDQEDSPKTEEAEGHDHALQEDDWTRKDDGSEDYYGLKAGDAVALLRDHGGQRFFVLGVM